MFFACRCESFKRALHNSLRADVNPRAGGHLPVHHQAGAFKLVEFLPARPMPDQVRVCDQHSRRILMRLKHSYRLARLHQQRLVIFKIFQCAHDRVIAIPITRSFPGTAIDHQIARPFTDFLIQIVHQHAHGGFLLPSLAGK